MTAVLDMDRVAASTNGTGKPMNIKKSVRVAMAQKDISQGDLASLIGMSASALSQMLNRKSITSEKLGQIATALDMKASELVSLGED